MDSFIAWIGGKRLLRQEICNRFPTEGITKYVEVFGGAAWVLLHKDKHAEFEVYNDLNGNLVNLFKCVKHHPGAIQEELDNVLNAREVFDNYMELHRSSALTDIQRAAMYLFLIRASYGSKMTYYGAKSRNITECEYLAAIKERLKRVAIENRSYEVLIKQYDRPGTLFYCDPPYKDSERYYQHGADFDASKHVILANLLYKIKGRCIISYNDSEYIRDLYRDFTITEVTRQNNLSGRYGPGKCYKELIITNY